MRKIETFAHLYMFTSPNNWRRILRQNPTVRVRYWPRLMRMRLLGWLVEPLRWQEQARYRDVIQKTQVHPSPVFIMGLWRSGTTHLHNLLGLDDSFGYASTLQCLAPNFIIGQRELMRRLLNGLMPKTRLFDNMEAGLDLPQEEEVAMANLSPHCFYGYWLFPSQMRFLFEKYMRLTGLSAREYQEWQRDYLMLLKQTSYLQQGKPLILKSPTNLTRTRELLKLFPDARFIEIQRHPLRTWLSFLHLQNVLLRMHRLEDIDDQQVVQNSLHVFTHAMQQWLDEKSLIPAQNLVSVRYEDLVSDPLHELQRIYEAFNLSTRHVLPRWQEYLARIAGYQTNRFTPSEADLEIARKHFGFLYEAGNYSP